MKQILVTGWILMLATLPMVVAVAQLPPAYAQRGTEQGRLACIAENGGTPLVEAAVAKSLEWLSAQQNADGSWGADKYQCAFTGLALQCFLAHGQVPDSAQYGAVVSKGLGYLIRSAASQRSGIISLKPESAAATYEHAIATATLGEALIYEQAGATATPGLRDAFLTAVKLIIAEQTTVGSWAYGGEEIAYTRGARSDLSLSNWHFLVLKLAKVAQLRSPSLDLCITKAVAYIESKQTRDGGFGNMNREMGYNQWSLTGGAVLGLQMLDPREGKEISKGMRFMRDLLTNEPLDWETNCNSDRLRFYTDAFFTAGGDDWKFYSSQLMPRLLDAQQPDGSFKMGEHVVLAKPGMEIFNQAICTLQLQVFYRLPGMRSEK
jgi:hypothetical protein